MTRRDMSGSHDSTREAARYASLLRETAASRSFC
jgi:hypothetical protein